MINRVVRDCHRICVAPAFFVSRRFGCGVRCPRLPSGMMFIPLECDGILYCYLMPPNTVRIAEEINNNGLPATECIGVDRSGRYVHAHTCARSPDSTGTKIDSIYDNNERTSIQTDRAASQPVPGMLRASLSTSRRHSNAISFNVLHIYIRTHQLCIIIC